MKVVLKCDDFWGNDDGRFLDFIIKNNIKISLGVIGKGLSSCAQAKTDYVKNNLHLIQPFNHSYWHTLSAEVKEFFRTSLKYQFDSITFTNSVIADKLGFKVETIGFPANACDHTATGLLSEMKMWDLKNIYYVRGSHNDEDVIQTGKKIIWIDEESVIQMHPFRQEEHDKCIKLIEDLKNQGAEFVWPNEL